MADHPSSARCAVDDCDDDGAYRMWFEDCEPCRAFHGTIFCLGHWMCIACTADLRVGDRTTEMVRLPNKTWAKVPESPLMPSRVTGVS